MEEALFLAFVYGLGAIGLFAIGAMPMRMLWLWRTARDGDRLLTRLRIAILLVAIALSAMIIMGVAKCLLHSLCGPSTSSGWIYCAFVGAIYLASEALQAIAARVFATWRRR